jgi:hypothetical protein
MKAYELVALIETPLKRMNERNIRPSLAGYLDMFNEYRRMQDEGAKKTFIVAYLCEKYKVGRTKFFELIGDFETEV